jgi:hypothetical protein
VVAVRNLAALHNRLLLLAGRQPKNGGKSQMGYRSGDVDLRGEVEDDVRVRGDDADAPSCPRHAKIAGLARVPI